MLHRDTQIPLFIPITQKERVNQQERRGYGYRPP